MCEHSPPHVKNHLLREPGGQHLLTIRGTGVEGDDTKKNQPNGVDRQCPRLVHSTINRRTDNIRNGQLGPDKRQHGSKRSTESQPIRLNKTRNAPKDRAIKRRVNILINFTRRRHAAAMPTAQGKPANAAAPAGVLWLCAR